MTIDQFRERMASDEPIVGGSDLHMEFHKYSQEALRITAEINGSYHTPEELRRLLSELWAIDVPESFGMFPPFYTDCGKNTHVGERAKTKAVSSLTTMPSSVITPRSARSITSPTRLNGQV